MYPSWYRALFWFVTVFVFRANSRSDATSLSLHHRTIKTCSLILVPYTHVRIMEPTIVHASENLGWQIQPDTTSHYIVHTITKRIWPLKDLFKAQKMNKIDYPPVASSILCQLQDHHLQLHSWQCSHRKSGIFTKLFSFDVRWRVEYCPSHCKLEDNFFIRSVYKILHIVGRKASSISVEVTSHTRYFEKKSW